MPKIRWGVADLEQLSQRKANLLSKTPHQKRARKKQTPPEPAETFSGTLRVVSVMKPRELIRRGVCEVHYEFDALVLQPRMSGIIQTRIVRQKVGERLQQALPGSIIRFDGRWSSKFVARELQILRGEIARQARTPHDYMPSLKPDGTWRWATPNVSLASSRDQFAHRHAVESGTA